MIRWRGRGPSEVAGDLRGVTRELDDLGHQVLTDRLCHWRHRWPLSANPHLLVSRFSAHGTQAMSDTYVKDLSVIAASLSTGSAWTDRNLEEALAYGPDPLHVAALFGLSEATSIRYSNQARRLLAPWRAPPR
jgi:hypothetical protein